MFVHLPFCYKDVGWGVGDGELISTTWTEGLDGWVGQVWDPLRLAFKKTM